MVEENMEEMEDLGLEEQSEPQVEGEKDRALKDRDLIQKVKSFFRKEKLWFVVAGVIIISGAAVAYPTLASFLGISASRVTQAEVRGRVETYLEESLPAELSYSLGEMEKTKDGALYKVAIEVGGQEFTSYVTKNGSLLFPQAVNLDDFLASVQPASGEVEGVVTRQRPDVKLFVMSYCPYGLQAEKAFLPAWDLLEEKVDGGIYFVNYIMHDKKEVDENLRQYCIEAEQPDRFIPYLACFVQEGDAELCLSEASVDQGALSTCTGEADSQFSVTSDYENEEEWLNGSFPKFRVHDDLNNQYGVTGSPTLVINDKRVVADESYCTTGDCFVYPGFERTPEGFKGAICAAFDEKPEECSTTLSTEAPTPGFGEGTTDTNTSGGCGS